MLGVTEAHRDVEAEAQAVAYGELRSPFMELILYGPERFDKEDLEDAKVGDTFTVEDCNDAGAGDWRCSILERKGPNQWVLLDADTATIQLESHPHLGDVDVVEEFGMYYRLPEDASLNAHNDAWLEEQPRLSQMQERIFESPRRKRVRGQAAAQQQKQAEEMQKRAKKTSGGDDVNVGMIVQVAVDSVDRARVDPTNATLVVVEKVEKGKTQKETKYRLACTAGVILVLYGRSYINPVPDMTAEMMGMGNVLANWQGMPRITLRAAMAVQSTVGGQGMVRCDCKGKCETNRCSCLREGRKCNSRCHKGNKICTNLD